eukprot:8950100-Alexandrium_andersonii.AAC.1
MAIRKRAVECGMCVVHCVVMHDGRAVLCRRRGPLIFVGSWRCSSSHCRGGLLRWSLLLRVGSCLPIARA